MGCHVSLKFGHTPGALRNEEMETHEGNLEKEHHNDDANMNLSESFSMTGFSLLFLVILWYYRCMCTAVVHLNK